MGTRKWVEIKNQAPVSVRARARAKAELDAELLAYNLAELRRLKTEMTQTDLAEALGINQSAVSKLERADDMMVSRLRGAIEQLGGRLRISAVFDDGEILVDLGVPTP